MSKVMKQIQLVRNIPGDSENVESLITRLEKDSRVKEGTTMTLKGDEREWYVLKVYDALEVPYHVLQMNHGWDNNI